MSSRKVQVLTGDGAELGRVSVDVSESARSSAAAVIAHGAGGNMDTPGIAGLQKRLASAGVTAIRFNFLYSDRGKKSPDPMPRLVDCFRSVADWVRAEIRPQRLFLGGRSMGGRTASYLVAGGYPCDGIFFVAYPLHPPGKRDQLRKDHLGRIRVPMLFVSGTNDAFASLDLLEPAVREVGGTLHLLEGADHGFKVPRRSGKTAKEIDDEVARTVLAFIESSGS